MIAWMQFGIGALVMGLAAWIGYLRKRRTCPAIEAQNEAQEEWHALHILLTAQAILAAKVIATVPTIEQALALRQEWSKLRGMAEFADKRYRLYVGSSGAASCDVIALTVLKELGKIIWAHDVRASASRMRRRTTTE
jgi:hypothetical protein